MSGNLSPLEVIAGDIGVMRFEGEPPESFARRVAYSASRFWVSSFCLDDGAEGKVGLTRQAINRRLSKWLDDLDELYPGLQVWFCDDKQSIASTYRRLIDLGEIVPNGFTDRYLAQPARLMPLTSESSLVVGLYDPTTADTVCNINQTELTVSGLATIASCPCEVPEIAPRWWETDWGYLQWDKATDIGVLEYASPTNQWSIRKRPWLDTPTWVNEMAVSRIKDSDVTEYYAARNKGGRIYVTGIGWSEAYELLYFLSAEAGNPVSSSICQIDANHALVSAPIGLIPGERSRILKALMWPDEKVSTTTKGVVRTEALHAIKALLNQSFISVRES